MYRISSLFLAVLLFTFLNACSSDSDASEHEDSKDNSLKINIETDEGEENIEINLDNLEDVDFSEAEKSLEDAIQKAADAINKAAGSESGEKVEAMNFRAIKEVMPSRLLGMERTSHTGEKNGMLGFSISQASAEYRDGDQRLDVDILDGGNMGIAKLGGMAWNSLDIDKESDDGYERTIELDGYKAYEKWDAATQKAELKWMYKNRYIISLEARGLDENDLRKALKRIDYDDLD